MIIGHSDTSNEPLCHCLFRCPFSPTTQVTELCPEAASAPTAEARRPDLFCAGRGAQCQGVDMSRLVKEGHAYVAKEKPLLDSIRSVQVRAVDAPSARSKVSASRFRLLSEEEAPRTHAGPTGAWYPKDEVRL